MNDLKNEKIILEVQNLVNSIESAKEEVNIYCDLMRQMFLAGSCEN
jgi:hypothetical protein